MKEVLSRQYAKLCDLRDFDDVELRERIHEIVPGVVPPADLRRKFWEYAMLALFVEDVGALQEATEALSVGAGHEEVLFWLANRVGRVVATDIYGEGGFAEGEADSLMLTRPSAFAPYPYREDRLEAKRMDARSLDFPDESFDVVFSLSVYRALRLSAGRCARASGEIGRVLRPGGHAFIVTECLVERHLLDSKLLQTGIRVLSGGKRCSRATPWQRAVDVFTPREPPVDDHRALGTRSWCSHST